MSKFLGFDNNVWIMLGVVVILIVLGLYLSNRPEPVYYDEDIDMENMENPIKYLEKKGKKMVKNRHDLDKEGRKFYKKHHNLTKDLANPNHKFYHEKFEDMDEQDMNENENHNKMEKMTNPMEDLQKSNCYPQDVVKPEELLPNANDVNEFSQLYPTGQGNLMNKNFIQAGFFTGIDTVGQTNRNSNLQLRSEPPNPQVQVSPWLQTTINPDVNRRPFEIGSC